MQVLRIMLLSAFASLCAAAKQSIAVTPHLSFTSRGMKLQRDLMAQNAGPIWAMVFLPGGDDILMTLKSGELKTFNVKNKSFTNIAGVPKVAVHGQGGLLDVALSPTFNKDQRLYLSYAKEVAKDQYTTALGSALFDGKALKDFKEIFVANGSSKKGEHFAGRIVVEADQIWLSVGERGDRDNAQKLSNHLGKILRLTRDGKAHPDNPFQKRSDALPEIYSYGHRNPQGLVRHPVTRELWAHEHGPRGGDEINILKAGLNYGWPKATYGREYYGPRIGEEKVAGTEGPVHHWTPSIAPCGMLVYSGEALPGWKGLVISGSLVLTHLNLIEIKDGKKKAEERLFEDDELRVREVEQGPQGEVWYATDDGSLFRIQKA